MFRAESLSQKLRGTDVLGTVGKFDHPSGRSGWIGKNITWAWPHLQIGTNTSLLLNLRRYSVGDSAFGSEMDLLVLDGAQRGVLSVWCSLSRTHHKKDTGLFRPSVCSCLITVLPRAGYLTANLFPSLSTYSLLNKRCSVTYSVKRRHK